MLYTREWVWDMPFLNFSMILVKKSRIVERRCTEFQKLEKIANLVITYRFVVLNRGIRFTALSLWKRSMYSNLWSYWLGSINRFDKVDNSRGWLLFNKVWRGWIESIWQKAIKFYIKKATFCRCAFDAPWKRRDSVQHRYVLSSVIICPLLLWQRTFTAISICINYFRMV